MDWINLAHYTDKLEAVTEYFCEFHDRNSLPWN